MRTTQQHHGMGLVEAVVVISISSVAFAAVLASAIFFLRVGLATAERAQALYLLEEGHEALRFLRAQGYDTTIAPLIGAGTLYLLPTSDGYITTTTSTTTLGIFIRSVVLESVYRRGGDDDIVPASAVGSKSIDPNTVRAVLSVTWPRGTVEGVTYLTNIYEE